MKIWEWLIGVMIGGIILIIMVISGILGPIPEPTAHINCSSAHIKILADKIDEQGQLLAAYEYRYNGLLKMGTSPVAQSGEDHESFGP